MLHLLPVPRRVEVHDGAFFLTPADRELIIPMDPRCESLNAAIAAAIVLWEMKR